MTKIELGKKRVCASCGAKFYDFNKTKVVCPKCGNEIDFKFSTSKKQKIAETQPREVEPEEYLEETDIEAIDILAPVEGVDTPEEDSEDEVDEEQ